MTNPILIVYNILNEDEELANMLKDMRLIDEEDENMIFTFDVREEYRKYEFAPIIRLTPIAMLEVVWSDNDSELYELTFAVEVFTTTVANAHDISTYINNKYKKEHNCIMLNQNLQYDQVTDLYNSFMRFKIYVNKGEI